MLRIEYDPTVKYWPTIDQIRKIITQTRVKGSRHVKIVGNLREKVQHALLKLLEEHPEVTLVTASRLIAPIESRAVEITSSVSDLSVDPAFIGISLLDLRASEDLTKLKQAQET